MEPRLKPAEEDRKMAQSRERQRFLTPRIRELGPGEARALLKPLSDLLIDVVASHASVGFLPPLDEAAASAYWRAVADAIATGDRVLLVAEQLGSVVGTVQLALELRSNGLHRAEVE